jgi:secreted PhoX family phosphatase
VIKGAAASVPLVVLGAGSGLGSELLDAEPAEAAGLTFVPISAGTEDKVAVPSGYEAQVVLQWGDTLYEGINSMGSDRGALNQTADLQNLRFGYNNDFIGYFPLPMGSKTSNSGILTVNHEYTNPELMFPGYEAAKTRKDIVDVELAAHGMSIVEVSQDDDKQWSYIVGSRYTRRITGETSIDITGPAAGHALLKTSADTTGTKVRGMLNNCGGGKTPWGTVLTAEENFNQYFGNLNGLPSSDPRRAQHQRLGLTAGARERGWEKFYSRFDIAKEPNEPFRFGWIVEIDPYNASSTPKQRTALGRMKHEAANSALGKGGQAVVYTGDDERFDYVYKFVSEGKYDPSNRSANMNLLDKGTLYVAKFNDDGSGRWMPMIYGEGALTKANGFANQGDVLINARLAGDALGATKMDRPEDIEVNPVSGKVYAAMTNNTNRTAAQVDKANPRASNRHGQVVEITESGGDHAATSFTWNILLLAGDPKVAADGANYAGFDPKLISPVS